MAFFGFGSGKENRQSSTTAIGQGFLKSDIQSFIKSGASLAKKNGAIGPTPQKRDILRTETFTRKEPISPFGTTESRGISESTNAGEFSSVTSDQLDNLVNIFTARKKNVLSARLQPGRKQLILSR